MFYHFRSRLSPVTWVLLPTIMAVTGLAQVDPGCPRGTHLNNTSNKCVTCLYNSYTDGEYNREPECHQCTWCNDGKVQVSSCNVTHNTGCQCPPGKVEGPEGKCIVGPTVETSVIHAPELLPAIARSTRTLTLTWQRPQGIDSSSPLSYQIHVNSSSQQLLNISVVRPKEAYVLEGLVPDTLYSISITLRTSMGESLHSNVVHERTQEAVIHAPMLLPAIARSTRTLTLTWQRPQGIDSSSLLSYEIHVNSTHPLLHISVVPPKEAYVIEGLVSNTLYSISVTLHTSMGESSHSNVIHERTQEAAQTLENNSSFGQPILVIVVIILVILIIILGLYVAIWMKQKNSDRNRSSPSNEHAGGAEGDDSGAADRPSHSSPNRLKTLIQSRCSNLKGKKKDNSQNQLELERLTLQGADQENLRPDAPQQQETPNAVNISATNRFQTVVSDNELPSSLQAKSSESQVTSRVQPSHLLLPGPVSLNAAEVQPTLDPAAGRAVGPGLPQQEEP